MLSRKGICLATAIVLLFSSLCEVPLWLLARIQVRNETSEKIREHIPDRLFTLFRIPADNKEQLNQLSDNEFASEGKMFDVVHKSYFNDTFYVYCLNDKTEDMLNQVLISQDEYFSNISDGRSFAKEHNLLIKKLNLLKYCSFYESNLNLILETPIPSLTKTENTVKGHQRIFIPPPRTIFFS